MRKKTQAAAGWPYWKDSVLEVERGSSRSHSVKNSLWKRLWTSHTTGYVTNEWNVFLWPSYFRRVRL